MSDNLSQDLKALGEGATRYVYDAPAPELLETFPCPSDQRMNQLAVVIDTSEFTSLCPKTGQPDWARIIVRYVPNLLCVESKSWKLYLGSYRNHGEFHESCVNRMLTDLVDLLDPIWIRVEGRFTPRGGIAFWPVAEWVHPLRGPQLDLARVEAHVSFDQGTRQL